MVFSFSSILKLSCSFSRITTGVSTRLKGGCSSLRGFATYELSDKDSEDDTVNNESTRPQSVNNNQNGFKSSESTVQDESDLGLYKAIILGEVGQLPIQKRFRNGRVVTRFWVGTGGIRNNKRPLENESPVAYADRSTVQWHRVAIYAENLGGIAMQHLKKGAHVYLEGNLESYVFNDRITGVVKRYREIAIRQNGRLLFLNNGTESTNTDSQGSRGVRYF